jgi:hypothetical protein
VYRERDEEREKERKNREKRIFFIKKMNSLKKKNPPRATVSWFPGTRVHI